jgi:hypothetical protein
MYVDSGGASDGSETRVEIRARVRLCCLHTLLRARDVKLLSAIRASSLALTQCVENLDKSA